MDSLCGKRQWSRSEDSVRVIVKQDSFRLLIVSIHLSRLHKLHEETVDWERLSKKDTRACAIPVVEVAHRDLQTECCGYKGHLSRTLRLSLTGKSAIEDHGRVSGALEELAQEGQPVQYMAS